MKRTLVVLFAFFGSWSGAVLAGEIFGTVSSGGKPVAKARVEIQMADGSYGADSDARGNYRVVVPKSGKGKLTVSSGSQTASLDMFSSERSLRYDLELISGAEPVLKRK